MRGNFFSLFYSTLKKKQNPRITVVTVCYNSGEHIEKTLDSVISQTYENKEYIVIDGASSDNTLQIIENYSDSIDIMVSEPDNGIYYAMNKAVEKASGEWIIFMNAGDVFAGHNVVEQISTILNKDADVIYGDIFVLKDGQLVLKESAQEILDFHRMPFCHQAVFTRTSLLKTFPFDEKYHLSADFKFYKQLKQYNFIFKKISIPITIYDKTGLSNSQRSKGLAENIAIIKEVDGWKQQLVLLPRLYLVKNWQTIRNLLKNK